MIYLDNAATSMPKPRVVLTAVARAMTEMASPGRGSSELSRRAEETLFALRQTAGKLFDCQEEQVVLTTSATHGLNIAIKSMARRGDRVVISGMEHNAVVRPLYAIGADVHVARCRLFDREGLLTEFDRLLTSNTRLCVMTHVSNVFGWVLPVEEVAELCRTRGIPMILDASQSAGCLPVSLRGKAFVAMPGHKGLMGPQGTGLLLCGAETKPIMEGGTGSLSRERTMPDFLPDRLEAGTPNMPGAAGLLAGMRWVMGRGLDHIRLKEQEKARMAAKQLRRIRGIRVFEGEDQTGVLSFVPEGTDCELLADRIATEWCIALRAGLHCAPLAHEIAGTLETGTIRASFGPVTTGAEVMELIEAVETEMRRMTR